jgi:hypothetical protein
MIRLTSKFMICACGLTHSAQPRFFYITCRHTEKSDSCDEVVLNRDARQVKVTQIPEELKTCIFALTKDASTRIVS